MVSHMMVGVEKDSTGTRAVCSLEGAGRPILPPAAFFNQGTLTDSTWHQNQS